MHCIKKLDEEHQKRAQDKKMQCLVSKTALLSPVPVCSTRTAGKNQMKSIKKEHEEIKRCSAQSEKQHYFHLYLFTPHALQGKTR